MDIELETIDLNELWIDVLSFTKDDFAEIEAISEVLIGEGFYKGDQKRCLILALAIWVDEGNGIHEANH